MQRQILRAQLGDLERKVHEEAALTLENKRWQKVLDLINSPNESDWRLAIIEADTMLHAILTRMQYAGDSIGEMLKGVERSDMKTLNDAWEAHKVRNRIAHEGSAVALSKHEAEHAINLYQRVFEEFHYV